MAKTRFTFLGRPLSIVDLVVWTRIGTVLVVVAFFGFVQDLYGLEAYLALVRRAWWSWKVSVPINLVLLGVGSYWIYRAHDTAKALDNTMAMLAKDDEEPDK